MSLCVNCLHRQGLECQSPLLKTNGGPGLHVLSAQPTRGRMSFENKQGCRSGKFFEHYPMPPKSCDGRATIHPETTTMP